MSLWIQIQKPQLSSAPTFIEVLTPQLNALREHGCVPFWKFIVDPNSFCNTLRNLQHSAHIIRQGQGAITWKKDHEMMYTFVSTAERRNRFEEQPDLKNSQAIVSLSQQDWQKWIKQYKLKEPMF